MFGWRFSYRPVLSSWMDVYMVPAQVPPLGRMLGTSHRMRQGIPRQCHDPYLGPQVHKCNKFPGSVPPGQGRSLLLKNHLLADDSSMHGCHRCNGPSGLANGKPTVAGKVAFGRHHRSARPRLTWATTGDHILRTLHLYERDFPGDQWSVFLRRYYY